MTHRERVMAALAGQEPDRVPMDLGGARITSMHTVAHRRLKAHLGLNIAPGGSEEVIINRMMQTAQVDERILERLDIDTRGVALGMPDSAPDLEMGEGRYMDEYQVVRYKPANSHYYDLAGSPLKGDITLADVAKFKWPDPLDPGRFRGLRERTRRLKEETDYAVILSLPPGFVHITQYLRGFEDWFMDLRANQKVIGALFDACEEHLELMFEEALRQAGDLIDIVCCSDDVAHQGGPLCHPDVYRQLIKPRHQKLYDVVHAHTKAPILYHTCGSVVKILDDLIEEGVNILNPVQVAAKDMDTAMLKQRFGDRLSFWGGIDTQHVLPHGTVEDVKAEVERRIRDLAPGGGYVVNAVHNIQPDVPPENVLALFQHARAVGNYPLAL